MPDSLNLDIGKIFTFLFLTLGPMSVIRPFSVMTNSMSASGRRWTALVATVAATLSVVFAATAGTGLLNRWGVSVGSLLIAAGILLFLVAVRVIAAQYSHGPDNRDEEVTTGNASPAELGFRIAFPYEVSPYGIAVVVLVLAIRSSSDSPYPLYAILAGIMLLNGLAMLIAHRLVRSMLLSPAISIVSSVMAVLQAALGVEAVLTGLKIYGTY